MAALAAPPALLPAHRPPAAAPCSPTHRAPRASPGPSAPGRGAPAGGLAAAAGLGAAALAGARGARRQCRSVGRGRGSRAGRAAADVGLPVGLPVRIETRGVPVLLYAPIDEVEEQARNQLISLAESPLPVGFVAAMPDVHMGKGVAIGAVFASEKYVCPNAVGVDIGCGMCAVPVTGLHKDDLSMDQLVKIQGALKQRIPTSFDQHKTELSWAKRTLQDITSECEPTGYLASRIEREAKIAKQLGSLGGGNHFIEVVYSEGDEQVWCMLHSGSRNVGNTTAAYYDKLAGEKGTYLRGVAGSLNYLEVESEEGKSYLKDMTWCQAYARENRRSMLDIMVNTVEEVTGKKADMERAVNAHHNFCQCEKCSVVNQKTGQVEQKQLWVTRKGATSARAGQYGIIPGSMGVGSYIVKGKGTSDSWQSCSHGAGRRMSRNQARKVIEQSAFEASMQGIVCDSVPAVRDEAPQAYKDLGQVLENQRDLVEVEHRLLPLVNVKGYEEKNAYKKPRKKKNKNWKPRNKNSDPK